jgi:CheY-like chemotaxis protein
VGLQRVNLRGEEADLLPGTLETAQEGRRQGRTIPLVHLVQLGLHLTLQGEVHVLACSQAFDTIDDPCAILFCRQHFAVALPAVFFLDAGYPHHTPPWSCLSHRPRGRRAMPLSLSAPVAILVIDDAPSFVKALALLLRRDGATVDTAANGQRALTLLQERCYDVILCDLHMPELDGPTFYAIRRSQYPHLRSRVIFLTGDTLRADRRTFVEACGQPWLSKPCTIAAIRRTIAHVLRVAPPLRPPCQAS